MSRDYERIASALDYIQAHALEQPSLAEIAAYLELSPHHFHRLFVAFCGLTPKQFLQVLTVEKAKALLQSNESTLHTTIETGLSSSSRLHEHFVSLEAVTPFEYKSKGDGMSIYWGECETCFGAAFIAWTEKGIHQFEFTSHTKDPVKTLKSNWPQAQLIRDQNGAKKYADILAEPPKKSLRLWLKGSNFQIKVWQALLRIQPGQLTSYGNIAKAIGQTNASRAVGSAIGRNPVALIIPCHRVIKANGDLGGYRWGETRKKILLTHEIIHNE